MIRLQYVCPICKNTFDTQDEYKVHIEREADNAICIINELRSDLRDFGMFITDNYSLFDNTTYFKLEYKE